MKYLHVAVAVIGRDVGSGLEILISKRAADAHQGGLWEFPGGKVELGESVTQALSRELNEELGLQVPISSSSPMPLIRIKHDYGDKQVLLDVWSLSEFVGEPRGLEGQPLSWVPVTQLQDYSFPEANKPIISAAQLPERYLITPDFESLSAACDYLRKACERGFSLLQFRQHKLTDLEYCTWSTHLLEVLDSFPPARLLLNRKPKCLPKALLARCGVHLSSKNAEQLDPSQPRPRWLAMSCHSQAELGLAKRLGVDFAVLSPLEKTQSHPEAKLLSWDSFSEWVSEVNFPVYALGGLGSDDIQKIKLAGGQGVAAISAWQHKLLA